MRALCDAGVGGAEMMRAIALKAIVRDLLRRYRWRADHVLECPKRQAALEIMVRKRWGNTHEQ